MHKIVLRPPVVHGASVEFEWTVEPASSLYRKTRFALNFPPALDLRKVPKRLWWDIMLMCLHPHWLLLRPCEVHLPLKLGRYKEFWSQHLRNGAETLAAYGAQDCEAPGVSFVDGTVELPHERVEGSGYGAAFSGGKDSLLQAGLLLELTEKPLLVATTSPMPPLADHIARRRREVFAAIQNRRAPLFVEVESDFRAIWDNGFAGGQGIPLAVNELTDTFLYTASLLAAGAALGKTRLFVASEAELQDNAMVDGKIVQHSHFMYSAATQRALAALVEPYGFRFGSLTWPLPTMQVQRLLWSRYPDLCDLQYSCWRVQPNEQTCGRCEQCLRIAATALAAGHDPQRMGIDLGKVIHFALAWQPIDGPGGRKDLPQTAAANRLAEHVIAALRQIDPLRFAVLLKQKRPSLAGKLKVLEAIWTLRRVQRRFRDWPKPPPMGAREAFFEWLDPDLRDRLMAIYTQYLPIEPRAQHLGMFERSAELTLRATAVLNEPHERARAQ